MAPDIAKDASNGSARVGLPLGSISQVTLISLVTLDALSHASYAYDAYECTFPLSLVSAGQVVLLRDTYLWVKRTAELSAKLSNQLKERGSVHGPFGS